MPRSKTTAIKRPSLRASDEGRSRLGDLTRPIPIDKRVSRRPKVALIAGAFALLVIASKQITSIALLVFWVAMGDLLYGRQAKRLFAPMMAGVTLGKHYRSRLSEKWFVLGIDIMLGLTAINLLRKAAGY